MCEKQEVDVSYKVMLVKESLKEWDKLNSKVKKLFEKKLSKVVKSPFIVNNKLSNKLSNCYKIKLNREGYRLVYEVREQKIIMIVWAVGKRERSKVYDDAEKRLHAIRLKECTEITIG